MVCGESAGYSPRDPRELCNRIFHTCYMGMQHSSRETRDRARHLAEKLGRYASRGLYYSYHTDCEIDGIVNAFLTVFVSITGQLPKFKTAEGTPRENLALQNVQVCL